MKASNNPRKYYESILGEKIPSDMELHHLDGNHWNNDIQNLLPLDTFFHKNNHKLIVSCHNGTVNSKYLEWYSRDIKEVETKLGKAIALRDSKLDDILNIKE